MRRNRASLVAVGLVLLLMATLAGVWSAPPGGAATRAATPTGPFTISTVPPLVPAFASNIPNYVVHCAGAPTTQIVTSQTAKVGGTKFKGPVTLSEPLIAGQDVQVTGGGQTYSIRCLPADFPVYSTVVSGQPQAPGYLVGVDNYAIAFDNNGVPVWWYPDKDSLTSPWDAKFLNSSTIAWNDWGGSYELHSLSGQLVGTVGGGSVPLDFHELTRVRNGVYLGIMDVTRNCPAIPAQCVNLSSWGLSAQSRIIDNVIVEFNASNKILWSWSAADHLNLATENANWRDQFPDVIHMNSVISDGNGGVIFSARHLDAVYRVDMKTGAVTWKIGGTSDPNSLAVGGDQYANVFSGQHFAQLLPDGTLTVQDNGSRENRQPRAIRFALDPTAKTATIVEQVSDPRAAPAFCCGSAVKLPTGDWVADWGAGPYVTELSPQGVPQITISFAVGFSYRADILGASVRSLRNGMDAMVPPLVVTG